MMFVLVVGPCARVRCNPRGRVAAGPGMRARHGVLPGSGDSTGLSGNRAAVVRVLRDRGDYYRRTRGVSTRKDDYCPGAIGLAKNGAAGWRTRACVLSVLAPHRDSRLSVHLGQLRLRLLEVAGLEPLGEPAQGFLQEPAGFGPAAPVTSQPGETRNGP